MSNIDQKDLHFEPFNFIGPLLGLSHKILMAEISKRLNDKDTSITMPQWITMVMLIKNNGMNQQKLGHFMLKNKATITSNIDQLEKKKWVIRVPDPNDRRIKLVYLTDLGKERFIAVKEVVADFMNEVESLIPQEDMEITKKTLKKLIKNYDKSDTFHLV